MAWLTENANLITALSTLGLLVATLVLARVTKQLLLAQEKLSEPDVIVSINQNERHPTVLNFEIENIGGGTAHNVEIKIIKDICSEWTTGDRESLADMPFLKQKFLKPHAKIYKMLGTYLTLKSKEGEFEVNYSNKKGKTFQNKFSFDLTQFEKLTASDSYENDMVKAINAIGKNLNVLARGRIKVDAFDSDDRKKEADAWSDREKQFRKNEETA